MREFIPCSRALPAELPAPPPAAPHTCVFASSRGVHENDVMLLGGRREGPAGPERLCPAEPGERGALGGDMMEPRQEAPQLAGVLLLATTDPSAGLNLFEFQLVHF